MDLDEHSEDGSYSSGYEDENGSESGSESGSGSSGSGDSSEEEEEEPVLKYKRFAKELVNTISGSGEDRNIICCIAVHPKVSRARFLNKARQSLFAHIYALI